MALLKICFKEPALEYKISCRILLHLNIGYFFRKQPISCLYLRSFNIKIKIDIAKRFNNLILVNKISY